MTIEAVALNDPTGAYVTLDEADTFLLRVADITAWTAADDGTKARALLQASDELDTLTLAGQKYDSDQARAFPRVCYDEPASWPDGKSLAYASVWDLIDGVAVVPEAVKLAAVLQAMSILRDPQRAQRLRDRADGVASQSAGGYAESYDAGKLPQLVCLEARAHMRPYLLKGGRIV
ncbi:MAG: DnaT-like ssDNA-binding protein [Planctomycetaceae bacterium]|nr:hypothetical protein [Planctomycetaceae bacterium]